MLSVGPEFKCRCSVVARPVRPVNAITWPALTESPECNKVLGIMDCTRFPIH